jgi:hypothetical protein
MTACGARWSSIDANGGVASLDIFQISLIERVLIETGPQGICAQDWPVVYLVCWNHAVYLRPLEVLGSSPEDCGEHSKFSVSPTIGHNMI